MERRDFFKFTGTSALAVAIAPSLITTELRAENGNLFKTYEKVQLKDADGNPLKASALVEEETYVFNYPHVATPALLVNLKTPTQKDVKLTAVDGTEYVFKGGHGAKGTIVAYSAICPHQLTHPQPEMSMFFYTPESGKTLAYDKGGVMVCTSHLSAFEPKRGGERVGGPADQGLAQIVLEIDADDNLWAVAVLGPDKFDEYFKAFKKEFKKFYKNKRKAKKLVKTEAKVQTLTNFTKTIISA